MDIANLERLCTENPTSPLFARLADAYLAEGRKSEARHILEVGLETYPMYVTGSLVYAKYLIAEQQFVEAQNFLLHVAAFSADYPGLRVLLEQCQRGIDGPPQEAVQTPVETAASMPISDPPFESMAATPIVPVEQPQPVFTELSHTDMFPHHEVEVQPPPVMESPVRFVNEPVQFETPAIVAPAEPTPAPIDEIEWPPPPPADSMEHMSGATFMERMEAANSASNELPMVSSPAGDTFGGATEWPPEPQQVFATPEEVQYERAEPAEPEQVFNTPMPDQDTADDFGVNRSFGNEPFVAAEPEIESPEPELTPAAGVVISSELTSEEWPPAPPKMMDDEQVPVEAQAAVSPVDDFGSPAEPVVAEPAVQPIPDAEPVDAFGAVAAVDDGFGASEPSVVEPEIAPQAASEVPVAPSSENAFGIEPVADSNSFGDVTTPEPPAPPPAVEPMQIQGGRIVSKTLAEIYTAQGVYEEAILTYKLLKQQRPDESVIWNARIAELEKKIKERGA